ncbi:TIGR02117 family protein [Labrys wisconsinensis]|uniref:Uncharacterized protein (TIGR02117 family) n=1 Tax=Labrys wisconsinensis TaxID=425677 RepID=A0ABU0J5M9_9HYPH|nr:TIGR02117 family protein [Labrys wisconsinensis]MDQ0468871.1 uncharacterized protein (TIGR02117 family) [Labrys wisconsinensis]
MLVKTILRLFAAAVAALILAGVLGTLVPRPFRPPMAAGGPRTHRILVLRSPIHTDIAVPLDAVVRERFRFLADAGIPLDLPAVRYVVFGWGGRAFYLETPTWSDLKPGPVLKALTLDASVMHVDLAGAVSEPQPAVSGFDLDEAGFAALLDFIDASFRRGPDGPIPIPGAAYTRLDGFFEANGRFNALFGCNTWTAAALRAGGLRTGWWNPLPWSLDLSMRLYD